MKAIKDIESIYVRLTEAYKKAGKHTPEQFSLLERFTRLNRWVKLDGDPNLCCSRNNDGSVDLLMLGENDQHPYVHMVFDTELEFMEHTRIKKSVFP